MEHCFLMFDAAAQLSNDQLEQIDLKLVSEMFPESDPDQTLEKLYSDGQPDSFYLIKYWCDIDIPIPSKSCQRFYNITKSFESGNDNRTIQITSKLWSQEKPILEKTEVSRKTFSSDNL